MCMFLSCLKRKRKIFVLGIVEGGKVDNATSFHIPTKFAQIYLIVIFILPYILEVHLFLSILNSTFQFNKSNFSVMKVFWNEDNVKNQPSYIVCTI